MVFEEMILKILKYVWWKEIYGLFRKSVFDMFYVGKIIDISLCVIMCIFFSFRENVFKII